MGCGDEKLSKSLTQTFTAHCNALICQQVTLSGDAEWPKVADAVIEAGWRVYGTNQPVASFSLAQAVLAYRSEYQVERSFGRLKGRPLSLTPMYVQRDDHATGLIRLLSIALRVLTLLEFVGRRQLATEGAKLAGLYAGNPRRETDHPTAERLLEAFQDITLTINWLRVFGNPEASHMAPGGRQPLHTREERSEKRAAPHVGAWDRKERCYSVFCPYMPWAMCSREVVGIFCPHRMRKQAVGHCALSLPNW